MEIVPQMESIITLGGWYKCTIMRDTSQGGRDFDASAQLMQRALVKSVRSVTCCTFARAVVFFVLHL